MRCKESSLSFRMTILYKKIDVFLYFLYKGTIFATEICSIV